MSESEQRAAAPGEVGPETRISKDKCLHAGGVISNPNGVFCEACGMKLVWVQAGQMLQAGDSLSPSSSSQAPGVSGSEGATPVKECGECDLLKSQIKTLELVIASQARLIESRKGIEAWALSQPDLDASKGVPEGIKGLVERLRTNVKRLEDLGHRWNKMAAHFAAGSEFVNDPERVLEALKSRQEMQQALRDKTRERAASLEQSLAAVREELTAAQEELRVAVEALTLASHDERLQSSGQDDYVLCKVRAAARSQKGGPDAKR